MGSDIKFLPMLSEMLSRDDFKESVDWDPDTPESHSFRIKNQERLLQKMEDVYGRVRRNNFEKDLTIRYVRNIELIPLISIISWFCNFIY